MISSQVWITVGTHITLTIGRSRINEMTTVDKAGVQRGGRLLKATVIPDGSVIPLN